MENIVIPAPLQICLDDVGWFNGADDRENGGSARTAMPRRHCAEDYAAIEELGRRLDMRINCGFVLGEWDPDNRLHAVPHLSKFGDSWDNAAYLDPAEAQRCAAVVRDATHIDIAVHGLLHNHYRTGFPYSNTDYYYRDDGVLTLAEEGEIRARLDGFFSILRHYGIDKTVNSFIPPNFVYGWGGGLGRILADYGIRYVSTPFRDTDMEMPAGIPKPEHVGFDGPLTVIDRNFSRIPWREVGSDPCTLPDAQGIFGAHWPNLLHSDPARHGEVIDRWEAYFRRCGAVFGTVLSRDMAFCAAQTLARKYARCTSDGEALVIDLTALPACVGDAIRFTVSAKTPLSRCVGGTLRHTGDMVNFANYEITADAPVIRLF